MNVEIENILPTTCQQAEDVESFFKALETEDDYFDDLLLKGYSRK